MKKINKEYLTLTMMAMNKYLLLLYSVFVVFSAFGQREDVEITTDSDRSIPPATRITDRPKLIDTVITSSITEYPLLILQEKTDIETDEIQPANINSKPQLSKLYNSYAKIGGGSRLRGLGEIYFNSVRSRKWNWGIHALHYSEWKGISDYAPSQYDKTTGKAYAKAEEGTYSYGGELNYQNQGLHYYGFKNPGANRDSISQRYNSIGFKSFFDSHKKDSGALNFKIGIEYNNFMDRKPKEDSLKDWRGKENFVGLKTSWQYNGSNNLLLSNLRADINLGYNDYRYGKSGDSLITAIDTGIVSQNTLIQFRPVTHFYGLGEKLQFKIGGELAFDIGEKVNATLYPVAEVRYSLFNDIFIPYIGVEGGLTQQRFENLARTNEFIGSNQQLKNESRYKAYFGIKGTLSSQLSFNTDFSFTHLRDIALFVNDTLYSSGNKFYTVYDTVQRMTIGASLSYQQNEKLKVDVIGNYHIYNVKNNPFAWNLPQFELTARGRYNVFDRLIASVDFTLETGRYGRVFDTSLEGVKEKDNIYYKNLGVIPDANIGVEFRYNKRLSIFANFNNIAAQNYYRWLNYPVNAFQFMTGLTFRF